MYNQERKMMRWWWGGNGVVGKHGRGRSKWENVIGYVEDLKKVFLYFCYISLNIGILLGISFILISGRIK